MLLLITTGPRTLGFFFFLLHCFQMCLFPPSSLQPNQHGCYTSQNGKKTKNYSQCRWRLMNAVHGSNWLQNNVFEGMRSILWMHTSSCGKCWFGHFQIVDLNGKRQSWQVCVWFLPWCHLSHNPPAVLNCPETDPIPHAPPVPAIVSRVWYLF